MLLASFDGDTAALGSTTIKFKALRFLASDMAEQRLLSVAYYYAPQGRSGLPPVGDGDKGGGSDESGSSSDGEPSKPNQVGANKAAKKGMRLHIRTHTDPTARIAGQPLEMLLVNIACQSLAQMESFLSAQACLAGKYLCMRVADENVVRIVDLTGRKGRGIRNDPQLKAVQESGRAEWHGYRTIKIQGMLEAMQGAGGPGQVGLRALRQHQVMLVKAQHGTGAKIKCVLQVAVGGVCKLYNLSSQRQEGRLEALEQGPQVARQAAEELLELGSLEDASRFGDPEEYIDTGFAIATMVGDGPARKQRRIVANERGQSYLVRTKAFDGEAPPAAYELGAVYRTFAEVDLYQLIQTEDELARKKRVSKIDSSTLLSTFQNQSVFSIFFREYKVYQQVHD